MESDDSGSPVTPRDRRFRVGPGLLVTAAFIGPGTVVTASKAGAQSGCGLLWTILFACFGTIVLQSLAARIGIVHHRGLGESLRITFAESTFLRPAIVLVISAIGIGNAAYQTGNLTGASTGIQAFAGGSADLWLAIIMVAACVMLLVGRYRWLHAVLVGLVILLSLSFLCTAFVSIPDADRVIRGMTIPRFSMDDLTLVLALIGTTIVPYNLFLHASGAAATWAGQPVKESIRQSDWDTTLAVGLGGLVTASIVVTASAAFFDTQTAWTSTNDISKQLEPSLGEFSSIAFAIGLFAAGLTSSITAPLATSYAVCGCLGWSTDPSSRVFRGIAVLVVIVGGVFALAMGRSPAATIIFAQVANGLLLPIVAVFLLMVVGRDTASGVDTLGSVRLGLARAVVFAVALLGIWRIASLVI